MKRKRFACWTGGHPEQQESLPFPKNHSQSFAKCPRSCELPSCIFVDVVNERTLTLKPVVHTIMFNIKRCNPTSTPRGFHVETMQKRSFPRRFNVEPTWCVCRQMDKISVTTCSILKKYLRSAGPKSRKFRRTYFVIG